eukprot:gene6337-4564_t
MSSNTICSARRRPAPCIALFPSLRCSVLAGESEGQSWVPANIHRTPPPFASAVSSAQRRQRAGHRAPCWVGVTVERSARSAVGDSPVAVPPPQGAAGIGVEMEAESIIAPPIAFLTVDGFAPCRLAGASSRSPQPSHPASSYGESLSQAPWKLAAPTPPQSPLEHPSFLLHTAKEGPTPNPSLVCLGGWPLCVGLRTASQIYSFFHFRLYDDGFQVSGAADPPLDHSIDTYIYIYIYIYIASGSQIYFSIFIIIIIIITSSSSINFLFQSVRRSSFNFPTHPTPFLGHNLLACGAVCRKNTLLGLENKTKKKIPYGVVPTKLLTLLLIKGKRNLEVVGPHHGNLYKEAHRHRAWLLFLLLLHLFITLQVYLPRIINKTMMMMMMMMIIIILDYLFIFTPSHYDTTLLVFVVLSVRCLSLTRDSLRIWMSEVIMIRWLCCGGVDHFGDKFSGPVYHFCKSFFLAHTFSLCLLLSLRGEQKVDMLGSPYYCAVGQHRSLIPSMRSTGSVASGDYEVTARSWAADPHSSLGSNTVMMMAGDEFFPAQEDEDEDEAWEGVTLVRSNAVAAAPPYDSQCRRPSRAMSDVVELDPVMPFGLHNGRRLNHSSFLYSSNAPPSPPPPNAWLDSPGSGRAHSQICSTSILSPLCTITFSLGFPTPSSTAGGTASTVHVVSVPYTSSTTVENSRSSPNMPAKLCFPKRCRGNSLKKRAETTRSRPRKASHHTTAIPSVTQ